MALLSIMVRTLLPDLPIPPPMSTPGPRARNPGEIMGARTKGFTLIETLLVIIILGVIVLIGFPKMSASMAQTNLRGARTTLINLLAKARTAATQTNRIALLKIEGNNAVVLLRPRRLPPAGAGDADTLGAV